MTAVRTERVRVPLSPRQAVGATSAVLWRPAEDGGAAFVLGHGAGTDMTHPTLRGIGRGLAERGHPVALFNFAYTEAGRKRPDAMGRLEAAFADVLEALRGRFNGHPLVLGGRSMGGRVASHLVAAGTAAAGLCLLGYPLHPAGRPERLRTEHWPRLRLPVLFVTGDRDRLCDLDLLDRERAAKLERAQDTLHVLAGADHGFGVRRRDGRTPVGVLDEVVGVVAGWAARLPAGATGAG